MKKWVIIVLGVASFSGVFYMGYKKGYNTANEEIQATIKLDNKTLENHEAKLDTIKTESDSAANTRLRKNLSTN